MSYLRCFALVLTFLFSITIPGIGQESNYQNYEVGSKATMLGGAVVAGIDDISATFYNPGYLSFIGNSSVSLETSTLFTGGLRIKNGAGQNINISSNFFDVIPSLIGGIVKSKKSPDWTFAYAAITVNSSLIEFNVRHSMIADIILDQPGEELYDGIYDYSNKIRENWIGASASKKISDNFGLGVSLYGVSYYQDFRRNQMATVSVDNNGQLESVNLSSLQQEMRFRSLGLLAKLGASYKLGKHSLGLTITTPQINIDLFSKGLISEVSTTYGPSFGGVSSTDIFYGDQLTTFRRTPLKFSFGYQYRVGQSHVNLSMNYNAFVKTYAMVTTNPASLDGAFSSVSSLSAYDMARNILNVAFGMRRDIREGLSFMLGAKTDFNFVTSEFLNSERFVPKMSYWNLYHLTGGIIWYTQKAHLTLGGDYAFGISNGDLQQVNLSDPVAENNYFGRRTTDTRTFHNQIYVVLGFSYNFSDGE